MPPPTPKKRFESYLIPERTVRAAEWPFPVLGPDCNTGTKGKGQKFGMSISVPKKQRKSQDTQAEPQKGNSSPHRSEEIPSPTESAPGPLERARNNELKSLPKKHILMKAGNESSPPDMITVSQISLHEKSVDKII